MSEKDVLGAFLLVNNPIVLSEEEIKDVQKAIKQLQQENKQLKDLLNKSSDEGVRYSICCFDLQQRIDKAIEYIKAVGVKPKEIDSFVLLDILKGSDKE